MRPLEKEIVHFILDHRVGGPHFYVKTIIDSMPDEYDNTIITPGNGEVTDFALVNLRSYSTVLFPLEVFINTVQILSKFWGKAKKNIVIFDVHGSANLAPLLAGRILKIPIIWHFHETMRRFLPVLYLGKLLLHNHPHRKVVVASSIKRLFGLTDAYLIPGGIDFEFWSKKVVRKSKTTSKSSQEIVMIGNITPVKGFDLLFDALMNIDIKIKVHLVGKSLSSQADYFMLLQKKAFQLSSRGVTVIFHGWLSKKSIRSLLQRADLFVLPSRSEACPLALLEAMASGCLCAGSSVGDVKEILGAKNGGFIITQDNPRVLQEEIKRMLCLPKRVRSKTCECAQKTIQTYYGQDRLARAHLSIYSELFDSK